MTETIHRAIARYIARRQEEATNTKGWRESGYLFASVSGAPLHQRNVTVAFHKLCDAGGSRRANRSDPAVVRIGAVGHSRRWLRFYPERSPAFEPGD